MTPITRQDILAHQAVVPWSTQHQVEQDLLLCRAMVRPGRERLQGMVEVDEAYWGGEESGVRGRQSITKALIVVAAEADGQGIGRIRLRYIPDTNRATLHGFIQQSIEPGSTVVTDGLQAYREREGYVQDRQIQKQQPTDAEHLLPRVHRVISLLKRWLMGTHQDHADWQATVGQLLLFRQPGPYKVSHHGHRLAAAPRFHPQDVHRSAMFFHRR